MFSLLITSQIAILDFLSLALGTLNKMYLSNAETTLYYQLMKQFASVETQLLFDHQCQKPEMIWFSTKTQSET